MMRLVIIHGAWLIATGKGSSGLTRAMDMKRVVSLCPCEMCCRISVRAREDIIS